MNAQEWRNIGCTQLASGNCHAAIASFLRAQYQGEDSAEFHREFANALWQARDADSAMREIYLAVQKSGESSDFAVFTNVAQLLASMADYAGSVKFLTKALAIKDDPRCRFNRALYMLAIGDWEKGWQEYETRMQLYPADFPDCGIPMWRGEPLHGKTLWVTYEQGMGDQIMFCRYVPWVQRLGASIIFDSHPDLVDFSLKAGIPTRNCGLAGRFNVPVHPGTGKRPDYHIAYMSLPARHRTTPSTVPPVVWFKDAAKEYSFKLPNSNGKKKVGIVWAGSKNHPGDATRSMPFTALLPLLGNDNCEFFSFQVNERGEDIKKFGAEPLINRIPLKLWMQTAAAIKEMDVLVTVDTACAHFAGSLGVKTYLMLAAECDFRWLDKGETTPWYKSVKIFRQPKPGDWLSVVKRVMADIDEMCDEKVRVA